MYILIWIFLLWRVLTVPQNRYNLKRKVYYRNNNINNNNIKNINNNNNNNINNIKGVCVTCKGSKCKPGTAPGRCTTCGGKGSMNYR